MQRWADWIARRLWWASLWLMRRRWMRRLQTGSMRWMNPERAEKARLGLVRQNAFARRIGLKMLRVVVLLVLASVLVQFVASAAIALVQSGVLAPRRDGEATSLP